MELRPAVVMVVVLSVVPLFTVTSPEVPPLPPAAAERDAEAAAVTDAAGNGEPPLPPPPPIDCASMPCDSSSAGVDLAVLLTVTLPALPPPPPEPPSVKPAD